MKKLFLIGAMSLAVIGANASSPYASVLTTSGDRSQQLVESEVEPAGTSTTDDAIVLTDRTAQEIDGFGFALTYASCYNLSRMPESERKALLKKTFSPTEGYGWKNRGGVTPEAEGRLTTENFLILTPKVSWPTGSFLFQRITSWRP